MGVVFLLKIHLSYWEGKKKKLTRGASKCAKKSREGSHNLSSSPDCSNQGQALRQLRQDGAYTCFSLHPHRNLCQQPFADIYGSACWPC